MKKLILTSLSFFFFLNTVNAQEPITVTITDDCAIVSGTFTYNGLLNGKNNYVQTINIDGQNIVFGVGFDSTKWVLYIDNDLTDPGYENNTVPVGLLPPFIGWALVGCTSGTMVISQTLTTNEIDSFAKSILLYPNPSPNYIYIESSNKTNTIFDYKIIDLTGRIVSSGSSKFNEKLSIQNLTNGNYVFEMKNQYGQFAYKKIIKN